MSASSCKRVVLAVIGFVLAVVSAGILQTRPAATISLLAVVWLGAGVMVLCFALFGSEETVDAALDAGDLSA
jgi:hypothetical protein